MTCRVCNKVLPPRKLSKAKTPQRKTPKPRARRCPTCTTEAGKHRRRTKVNVQVQYRWSNSARKYWPGASRDLYSMATVNYVLQECNYQSVIDASRDNLCIISVPHPSQGIPTMDQLALVTTRQAKSISHMSHEKRAGVFLDESVLLEIKNLFP